MRDPFSWYVLSKGESAKGPLSLFMIDYGIKKTKKRQRHEHVSSGSD
jgi:hypothetical protein